MANSVVGHATRFGAAASGNASDEFEFISCDFGSDTSHRVPEGMRGDRSLREQSVVEGTISAEGTVVLEVRPDDIEAWLPRILGSNTDVAATVTAFSCHVERSAECNLYSACKVDRATFTASSTQNLRMSLDIVGTAETAVAFPSIAATLSDLQPYVLHQAVITIGGNTYAGDNLEIVVANNLLRDRFFNTQTRTEIPEGSREVTLSLDNPFNSDDTELYTIDRDGLAGNVKFTNGNYSITFTFANLKMPRTRQGISGRNDALDKRLTFTSYATDANSECEVVNDYTG